MHRSLARRGRHLTWRANARISLTHLGLPANSPRCIPSRCFGDSCYLPRHEAGKALPQFLIWNKQLLHFTVSLPRPLTSVAENISGVEAITVEGVIAPSQGIPEHLKGISCQDANQVGDELVESQTNSHMTSMAEGTGNQSPGMVVNSSWDDNKASPLAAIAESLSGDKEVTDQGAHQVGNELLQSPINSQMTSMDEGPGIQSPGTVGDSSSDDDNASALTAIAENPSGVEEITDEDLEAHSGVPQQGAYQVGNELLEPKIDLLTAFKDEGLGNQNPGMVGGRSAEDDKVVVMLRSVLMKLGIPKSGTLVNSEVLANCTEYELFERMTFLRSVGVVGKQLTDMAFCHPSILTLDLVKGLAPALECLMAFGVDKSALGEMLVADPGSAEPLIHRALEDRFQAMKEFDFSTGDIRTILKQLPPRNLAQFVRLPVEKLGVLLSFLQNLGLERRRVIKALMTRPIILVKDLEEDFKSKSSLLEGIVGDKDMVRKIFVSRPELFVSRAENFEEVINFMKSFIGDIQEMKRLINKHPIVLSYQKITMQQLAKYLESIGFNTKDAIVLLARQHTFLFWGQERLQKCVEFLKTKGLDEETIRKLIEKSPRMITSSLKRRVAPSIAFLERQGFVGEDLRNLILSRPTICETSLQKTMAPNLKFLLHLGFQENSSSLRSALKATTNYDCKWLQSQMDRLVSLGIKYDKVCKMVQDVPSILVMEERKLKSKVEFLVNSMNRSVQELETCPSFLNCHFEKIIRPRARVLSWLQSRGALEKDIPLSTIVEMPEESFVKQFVEMHAEGFSVYRGNVEQAIPHQEQLKMDN